MYPFPSHRFPGVDGDWHRILEQAYFLSERPELTARPGLELAGLYDVPWQGLEDAYGPAYFVPFYIEALCSFDPEDRDWGWQALNASIIHQGSPSPASCHAIPFLLDLLKQPGPQETLHLSQLLQRLAIGEEVWSFAQGADLAAWHRTECYEAVAAGAPHFVALLDGEDQAFALRLVAWIEECARAAWPKVQEIVATATDEAALANAVTTAGIVSARLRSGYPFWQHFGGHASLWVRGAAAIAHSLQPNSAANAEVAAALATLADVRAQVPHQELERRLQWLSQAGAPSVLLEQAKQDIVDNQTAMPVPPGLVWDLNEFAVELRHVKV